MTMAFARQENRSLPDASLSEACPGKSALFQIVLVPAYLTLLVLNVSVRVPFTCVNEARLYYIARCVMVIEESCGACLYLEVHVRTLELSHAGGSGMADLRPASRLTISIISRPHLSRSFELELLIIPNHSRATRNHQGSLPDA